MNPHSSTGSTVLPKILKQLRLGIVKVECTREVVDWCRGVVESIARRRWLQGVLQKEKQSSRWRNGELTGTRRRALVAY